MLNFFSTINFILKYYIGSIHKKCICKKKYNKILVLGSILHYMCHIACKSKSTYVKMKFSFLRIGRHRVKQQEIPLLHLMIIALSMIILQEQSKINYILLEENA